jgi:uncharacterized protein
MRGGTSGPDRYAAGLVRRADARERERSTRRQELRARASAIAERLRDRWGNEVRVFLFGSVTDPDLYHLGSDLDIAVKGLGPSQYWQAWGDVEALAGDAALDFVRLEGASESLQKRVLREGEQL